MSAVINVTRGGPDGGTLLVLLHGLGHTAEVWRPLVDVLPPEQAWLAPDLPGHGASGWLNDYTVDRVAAEVARVLPDRPMVLVGHSFGGVIALRLAALLDEVRGVLGFGIKVAWTPDELSAMATRAARPPRIFATTEEARAAFLRFAGLDGAVAPGSELAASGVRADDGGFRLATDPRTMAVGAPDMPALLAAVRSRGRVLLARGEHDHMVSADQLHAVDPAAITFPGATHNLHVTDPGLLLAPIATLSPR